MIAARSGTMRARDGVVDEGGDHDSAATVDLPTDVSKITHGTFRRLFSSDRQLFASACPASVSLVRGNAIAS